MFYVQRKCKGILEMFIINKLVLVTSLLFLTLDYTSVERGGGVWALNATVLKSNVYQECIKWILEESQINIMYREEKKEYGGIV